MKSKYVKLAVFVPETHTDIVRTALGEAGAGKIGSYSHCTFSTKGVGRFLALESANPSVGKRGKLETVTEERIETVCLQSDVLKILGAVKRVHPYEAMAVDVYPLLNDPLGFDVK